MPTPRGSKVFVAAKGAPEIIRHKCNYVPDDYETTYKFFTRRGSRVLALGYKYIEEDLSADEVKNQYIKC